MGVFCLRVAHAVVDLFRPIPAVSAEFDGIAVEDQPVGSGRGIKSIVGVGAVGIEIESENQPAPLKTQDVVAAVFVKQIRPGGCQQPPLPGADWAPLFNAF